jgi:carboxyl-terminal processing protease
MVEELKKDGLEESMKEELEALKVKLDLDKESFLRLKKDEIVPFIEQSIVARYYFQEAAVEISIRYDDALRQALVSLLIQY